MQKVFYLLATSPTILRFIKKHRIPNKGQSATILIKLDYIIHTFIASDNNSNGKKEPYFISRSSPIRLFFAAQEALIKCTTKNTHNRSLQNAFRIMLPEILIKTPTFKEILRKLFVLKLVF